MPRQYPTAFREEMVHGMLGGEPVLALFAEAGVPEQTSLQHSYVKLIVYPYIRGNHM